MAVVGSTCAYPHRATAYRLSHRAICAPRNHAGAALRPAERPASRARRCRVRRSASPSPVSAAAPPTGTPPLPVRELDTLGAPPRIVLPSRRPAPLLHNSHHFSRHFIQCLSTRTAVNTATHLPAYRHAARRLLKRGMAPILQGGGCARWSDARLRQCWLSSGSLDTRCSGRPHPPAPSPCWQERASRASPLAPGG
jgi:hypothetical protein